MQSQLDAPPLDRYSTGQPVSKPSRRRKPKKHGIFWLLNRVVAYTIYLPLVLVARLFVNVTRLHGQARAISVDKNTVELKQLPAAFDGLTVAFLTDLHCSAMTPPNFLEAVVDATLALKPDVILLGGDYISDGDEYVAEITRILARLEAPLGVYGVLGNHDFYTDTPLMSAALKRARIVELYNSGTWLKRGENRLRVAGVGDFWEDDQDLTAALGDAGEQDTVILLSHNPDYAMEITDPRVDLVLSGHTHGGQINLPRYGTVFSNSRYAKRLVRGFVNLNTFQLYVSRGIGTVMLPLRLNCPPEITHLTLRTSR